MTGVAHARPRDVGALVIGASAGGIDALLTILPGLPTPFDFPVVVVLHVPEDRDTQLATVFSQRLHIPVQVAGDKETALPGIVYFAGPAYHLSIEQDFYFSVSREEPVHYSRPSIDVLMVSAADAYRERLMAVLLTGASADGAAGIAYAQSLGAFTVVQDPLDADIATMPRAALALCTPDMVLPLTGIRTLFTTLEKH